MKDARPGKLLRIYLAENDRWEQKPLYEALVLQAREMGLAGATVLRGPMGFGAHHKLHNAKILRLALDLPIVIELVDSQEKLEAFVGQAAAMLQQKMVTMEEVEVLRLPGAS